MGKIRIFFLVILCVVCASFSASFTYFHTYRFLLSHQDPASSSSSGLQSRHRRAKEQGGARKYEKNDISEPKPVARTLPDVPPVTHVSNSSDGRDLSMFRTGDDDELLAKATLVEQRSHVTNQKPKVAFLFLTRGPLPLARLWSLFFVGHEGLFSIYVHASQSAPEKLPAVFKGSVVPSKKVEWGKISVVDAERRLLANAILDPANSRFILLSESCIPVFNFTTIYTLLMASDQSFVRVIEDPRRISRERWNRHFLPLVPRDQWQKGSQWFVMTREAAAIIASDNTFYPLFKQYCVPHCYSDEHYFPTLLTMRAAARQRNRTLTWTDWSRGGWHPEAFGRRRINKGLIDRIRKEKCDWPGLGSASCYLFARKFKPDSLGPLLFISSYLGF